MKAKRLFLVISFLELQFMVSSAFGGVYFNYTDFSSIAGIDLVGDAFQAGNRIHLTPSVDFQAGAAWYNTQVSVVSDWETVFEFQIPEEPKSSPSGADGLAFVIQNDIVSALGLGGGYIGYEGITHSLAVEFDTHENPVLLGDPDENHISVQTREINANSANHAYSLGGTSAVPGVFEDGSIYTVKISYVPDTLTIFVNNLTTPVLTVGVNLSDLGLSAGGKAWIGFTAATGQRYENQDILSWSFVPEPATVSLLGLGSLVLLRKRRA